MNGVVVKISSNKTAMVKIERNVVHPLYKKRIKLHSKIMVHDDLGVSVGDNVSIIETAPISKNKKHKIKEKL